MAAKRKSKPKDKSFEQSLAELEEVIAKLESGEIPLDESIELYERGIASFRRCGDLLREAEKRIELLVADAGASGGLRTERFDSAEPEDEQGEKQEKGGDLFR